MTTAITTAMETGEIVWAKKTSRSSTSEVMVETRLPRSCPASFAGASSRSFPKTRSRTCASSLNAM